MEKQMNKNQNVVTIINKKIKKKIKKIKYNL